MKLALIIIGILIILIVLTYQKNVFEYFDNEALSTISSMYNNGVFTASNLKLSGNIISLGGDASFSISNNNGSVQISPNLTTGHISASNISTSNVVTGTQFCFDASHCMDITMFNKLSSLNSYILGLSQRMYLPNQCTIYSNPFVALQNNFIALAGTISSYDATSNSGSKLWNGLNLIKFGASVENFMSGLQVNVPAGHTVVWVRVLNDRWTRVCVQYADTKVTAGNFTGGKRSLNKYAPDGGANDFISDKHCWVPMALTRSTPVIITPRYGTDGGGFFISGIATSTNPWNHITVSAVGHYWNVNGSDQTQVIGSWNSDSWNNDILWETGTASIIIKLLVIPSGRDKLVYFVEHNNTWDSSSHISLKIGSVGIERLATSYTNPFATHHNSKPYQRYLAAKIPASVVGTSTVLDLTFDMTGLSASFYVREIGTHDFYPFDGIGAT